MTSGEKIASLRKAKGMTQAELGEKLNVTFQAVSKWERGESYPDFEMMTRIAKLFEVSLEYFSEEGETAEKPEQEEKKEMLGVCKECGKVVYAGDEYSTTPFIVCKACNERKLEEKRKAELAEKKKLDDEKKRAIAAEKTRRAAFKRKRNIGLVLGALVAIAYFVLYLINGNEKMETGMFIFTLIAGTIFLFTFISQLYWDGAVRDIVECGGKIVGTPGIIFTFDWDGIKFLIGMKILFAIIRFVIWLVTIIFFVIIGFFVSPFTFIPRLIKLCRADEADIDVYDAEKGKLL